MTAAERAQATLLEHCSERQRGALPQVSVSVGLREYRIAPYGDVSAIVQTNPAGFPVTAALVSTRQWTLPAADCMLAAKLLLEADPDAFLYTAARCGNVWLD